MAVSSTGVANVTLKQVDGRDGRVQDVWTTKALSQVGSMLPAFETAVVEAIRTKPRTWKRTSSVLTELTACKLYLSKTLMVLGRSNHAPACIYALSIHDSSSATMSLSSDLSSDLATSRKSGVLSDFAS